MIVRAYEGLVDHDCTVVAVNKRSGGITLELSTGQPAYCPRRYRMTDLDDLREGATISVRVLEEREDRNFRPTYFVEEVTADTVGISETAAEDAAPAASDEELRTKFPAGMRVRGTFKGTRGEALRVLLNGEEALLPYGELGSCRPASFRPNVALKAWVHYVENGVVYLTKKEPKAEAAA